MYSNYEIVKLNNMQSKTHKNFIIKFHYKKSPAKAVTNNYALMINNKLMGIIQYGIPTSKDYNCNEIIELKRLVLHPKCLKNTATWLMSKCHKLLKNEIVTLKYIISYCEDSLHSGTIYKAANFDFVRQSINNQCIKWNGKQIHLRQAYQKKANGEYTNPAKRIQNALLTKKAKYVSLGSKSLYSLKVR